MYDNVLIRFLSEINQCNAYTVDLSLAYNISSIICTILSPKKGFHNTFTNFQKWVLQNSNAPF